MPFPTFGRPLLPGEQRQIYRKLQKFRSRRRWEEAPFSVRSWVKRWLVAWFWLLLISVGLAVLANVLLQ